MMAIGVFAGYLAGCLSLTAHATYIFGTLCRRNRPMLLTWIIWAFTDWGLFASFSQSGAGNARWLQLAYAIGNTTVAIVASRYGGFRFNRVNATCLGLASVAVVCLVVLHSPQTAFLFGMAGKFTGYLPTYLRLYRRESEEYLPAWTLWTLANLVNFLAVSDFASLKVLLPIQYSTQCLLVVVMSTRLHILRRREECSHEVWLR